MKTKIWFLILIIALVAIIIALLVIPNKTKYLPNDIQKDIREVSDDMIDMISTNSGSINSDLNTEDLDFVDQDLAEIEALI